MSSNSEDAAFTIGIEEEMFLVDAETLACVLEMPPAFRKEAERHLGEHFSLEMVPSIVEIVTGCHTSMISIAGELSALRRELADIAARHGLALLACGTHPFSDWIEQSPTHERRYSLVSESVKMTALRSHACGLHVHVGIEDETVRMAVFNRVQRFLPLLLALSASSPFWRGRNTGLQSFRTAANSEMPRTGLPGPFASVSEYKQFVATLVAAGHIADETYLWWALRPSARFPTLELRATDCCTRVEDSIAIAALYRSLVATLADPQAEEPTFSTSEKLINDENVWQAARHGTVAKLIDASNGAVNSVSAMLEDLMACVQPAAHRLDGLPQVRVTEQIVDGRTSAERQVAVHEACIQGGGSDEAALLAVARHIAQETVPILLPA